MSIFSRWFGFGGAIGENVGTQNPVPTVALVSDAGNIGPDGALQISAVWSCIDRRATTIASLPFFAYEQKDGQKELARKSRLYTLLHESPNERMTPFEFWRAMIMNHDLRGNAYARIERDSNGEATSLWPMPADQVEVMVLDDGSMVYRYALGNDVAIHASENVLHLKNLGNGTVGLAKLEFMRSTTDEAAKAQSTASKVFGTGGKPTGVLMLDKVLNPTQRTQLQSAFAGMSEGNTSRLYVLEANMKYEQLSMSPEDQQLLETRKFTVEEICRWFDVPPVLVHHSNVTTWGSGIEQIVDGFYKLTIRPMLVSIEQATRKRVMTARQRATMTCEFALDALLRGSPTQRADLYSKNVQNGIMTRNECRQLENLAPMAGADELTAQSNLLPLKSLGQSVDTSATTAKDPILQSMRIENMEIKAENYRRNSEMLQVLRSVAEKPEQKIEVINSFEGAIMNITRTENIQPPVVEVTNYINPTPVDVQVTNQVNPTPIEANFEAIMPEMAPVQVELTMPARKTEGSVTRNDKGEIIKTVTYESNV